MPLLSLPQLILSVLIGGLMGGLVAAMLGFTPGNRTIDGMELVGGAWLGFALTCAAVMIQNCTSHRKSE